MLITEFGPFITRTQITHVLIIRQVKLKQSTLMSMIDLTCKNLCKAQRYIKSVWTSDRCRLHSLTFGYFLFKTCLFRKGHLGTLL